MTDRRLKVGDKVVLIDDGELSLTHPHLLNRPGVIREIDLKYASMTFDDTGDYSPYFYHRRFKHYVSGFTLDFKTDDVDVAIKAAEILSKHLNQPVGVIRE